MANVTQLPCDGDGICMVCKATPSDEEKLTCRTCATPWHVSCLSCGRPETLASALQWECPDCCTSAGDFPPVKAPGGASDDLIDKIRAIEADASLTEREKAKRRQELMVSGKACVDGEEEEEEKKKKASGGDVLDLLGGSFNCSFCMQLPERPVTVRFPFLRFIF
jgi:E3 ubiquitin-protein ligase UHRF1